MDILSFLSGILLAISNILGIQKEVPKSTVLSVDVVAPTETPIPTSSPTETPIPTKRIYPTKIPPTSTPSEDLQKKVEELSKKVDELNIALTPTQKIMYTCKNELGNTIMSSNPCRTFPPTPTGYCYYESDGIKKPCN